MAYKVLCTKFKAMRTIVLVGQVMSWTSLPILLTSPGSYTLLTITHFNMVRLEILLVNNTETQTTSL